MFASSSQAQQAQPDQAAKPISISGVYNGSYDGEQGPTKFKLTITHLPDGDLAGVATIYLPTDSGIKAYTYSLRGAQTPYAQRDFDLRVNDWDTIPPKDFKDFKGMGFNGRFLSNMTQNSARIISVEASGDMASYFVPKFEATWDATESADISGDRSPEGGGVGGPGCRLGGTRPGHQERTTEGIGVQGSGTQIQSVLGRLSGRFHPRSVRRRLRQRRRRRS